MATSEEIQNHFDPSHFVKKDKENYNYHLDKIENDPTMTKVYGLKKSSILNELNFFHVTTGLPPDYMHDLLEGIAKKEIPVILPKLIRDPDCDLNEYRITSQIQTFKNGKCDTSNKPAVPKSINNIASQSAAQMWTLICFIPLMLGEFVPRNNNVWEVLLLLKDLVEIVMSPVLELPICPYLQSIITDHHGLFKEIFPEVRLSPKHHFSGDDL